jgi:hypothetical protein
MLGLLAATACSGSSAQCPKAPASAAPSPSVGAALDEKSWKDSVEASGSHVAVLLGLAEKLAKKPSGTGTTRYVDCVSDALGRLHARDKGNPMYPAALKQADQEMTWCFQIHCAHELVPANDGRLQFETLCD